MNIEAVIALLNFLDTLFNLGGKLIEAAVEKHPELKKDPLPDLSSMDKAREEALKRIK